MCISAIQRTLNNPTINPVAKGVGLAAVAYASVPAAVAVCTLYGLSKILSREKSAPTPSLSAAPRSPVPLLGPAGVIANARKLGTPCEEAQLLKTETVMGIHDQIEEVAYKAFADIVEELGIKGDAITEEQSGKILAYIKKQAHVEMYKKGGYIAKRGDLLGKDQIQFLLGQVGKIIHDRDTKLTDARYHSLSSLLLALDDHNAAVKDILIKSWFRCPVADPTHLDQVKERIRFYDRTNASLGIDLQAAVERKAEFWDRYFPGLRDATEIGQADRSAEFVRILEVRNMFGGVNFMGKNLEAPLSAYVSINTAERLFQPRQVPNLVRRADMQATPLISDSKITLGTFLRHYFPEVFEAVSL